MPPGVWDPAPGEWIRAATFAADNDTLWWVIASRANSNKYTLRLTATSSTGASIVAPAYVIETAVSAWEFNVAVTPSAIVVEFVDGTTTFVRRFDRTGAPLGEPYPVVLQNGERVLSRVIATELVPTADGGFQLVAPLYDYDDAEAVIVNFDASGTQTTTVFVGAPNTIGSVQSTSSRAAAAPRPDGSTLIAWDRHYSPPFTGPVRPASTLTTSITGTTVGATQPVQDLADLSELAPAIAASGDTAYIMWHSATWRIDQVATHTIALAKFPDVATPLVELDPAGYDYYETALAVGEPGHGALTYRDGFDIGDDLGTRYVVGFAESGGSVELSEPRVIPKVVTDFNQHPVGLVHVGGDRYVLGWLEIKDGVRLFATEIDFR